MKRIYKICIILIISLFIFGCSSNKRTFNYLMDEYVKAYLDADSEKYKDVFPPYYVAYAKDYMTEEYLESTLEKNKEKYGKDFNITYEITKTSKMTEKELNSFNKKIENYFKIVDKATECYQYEGAILFKGSKKEESNSMITMAYCKYDDVWYLVRK